MLSIEEIRFISIVQLLLKRSPSSSMHPEQIIRLGEQSGWLTHRERASVPSRNDSRFANSIHNIVSHRTSKRNPIKLGLLQWNPYNSHLTVTAKGLEFLEKLARKLDPESTHAFRSIEQWLLKMQR